MQHDSFTSIISVRNVLQTTALLTCMALAADVSAQTPPATNPATNPTGTPNQKPDMGGPPVATGAADSSKSFDGAKQGAKKGRGESGAMMNDERVKGMMWMRTYDQMKSTLSADTQAKVEVIKAQYQATMKTWNDANAEKMKSLREQMKNQKDDKASKAVGDQMKALRDTMPKMDETQKQIFALMSESEQAAFKSKLEVNEKEMKSLRPNRDDNATGPSADGKGKGKGKGPKGKGGPGASGTSGDGPPPQGSGSDKAPPPPPFDP